MEQYNAIPPSTKFKKHPLKKARFFTLLEVIVAIAILALTFVAALELAASSSRRSAKALNNWKRQHMLTQATEFFLLAGAESTIPNSIFPYEGFQTECTEEESPDIPKDVEAHFQNWRLVKLRITIRNNEGVSIASIALHKILNDHNPVQK